MIKKALQYFRNRLCSFKFAINGFIHFLKTEKNAQIHLLSAVVAVVLSYYYNISSFEWLLILLAIGIVFAGELLNTAIEKLADFVEAEYHPEIGKVKDLSAAAVLICSVLALAIGVYVFWNYFFQ